MLEPRISHDFVECGGGAVAFSRRHSVIRYHNHVHKAGSFLGVRYRLEDGSLWGLCFVRNSSMQP